MSCADSARKMVLESAELFEMRASNFAILRSLDATKTAEWLREVAAALREACGPDTTNEEGSAGE